eukprot:Ihof_evm5s107 gene=Ihof_evmTU5s107
MADYILPHTPPPSGSREDAKPWPVSSILGDSDMSLSDIVQPNGLTGAAKRLFCEEETELEEGGNMMAFSHDPKAIHSRSYISDFYHSLHVTLCQENWYTPTPTPPPARSPTTTSSLYDLLCNNPSLPSLILPPGMEFLNGVRWSVNPPMQINNNETKKKHKGDGAVIKRAPRGSKSHGTTQTRHVRVPRETKGEVGERIRAMKNNHEAQVAHLTQQYVVDLVQLLVEMGGTMPYRSPPTSPSHPPFITSPPRTQEEGMAQVYIPPMADQVDHVADRLGKERMVLEGLLGPDAFLLDVDMFTEDEQERITLRVQQHINQMRYLATVHRQELKLLRPRHTSTNNILAIPSNTTSDPPMDANMSTLADMMTPNQLDPHPVDKPVAVADPITSECNVDQNTTEIELLPIKIEPGLEEPTAKIQVDPVEWSQLTALIKKEVNVDEEDPSLETTIQSNQDAVSHLTTPLRTDTNDTNELLISYCNHWLTLPELQIINAANLMPFPDHEEVHWMTQDTGTALLSVDQHVCKAYHQAITEFPKVFQAAETRKTLISKRALAKVIAYNPSAVGLRTRREYVAERKEFERLTKNKPDTVPTIGDLLKYMNEGVLLHKSCKFFPSSNLRAPFTTIEECHDLIRRHFETRIAPGFVLPGIDDFKQTLAKGKEQGFHLWYSTFHDLIYDACMGVEEEVTFFLSLLATASPNSGVHQNTLNALLNFRALSQDSRPRWGSYPARNLVNYLAGTLGAASGMKIMAFLDNLVNASTSQAVTIDTHMQRFALGEGHLSLKPHEYAILEDFYRCAANQLNENPPHRLQAAIWCTLAGPYSFKEELLQCRAPHTFRLAPDPPTLANYNKTLDSKDQLNLQLCCDVLRHPHGRRLACNQLRQKLLSIGYMSLLANTSLEEDADSWADLTLLLFVPTRMQHPTSIRSHLTLRRNYAKRQSRTLLRQEEEEAEEQLAVLREAESSASGFIPNQADKKWFERDMAYVRAWLLQETMPKARLGRSQGDEKDPYFKTHAHFVGAERCLSSLLIPGSFHLELVTAFAN